MPPAFTLAVPSALPDPSGADDPDIICEHPPEARIQDPDSDAVLCMICAADVTTLPTMPATD